MKWYGLWLTCPIVIVITCGQSWAGPDDPVFFEDITLKTVVEEKLGIADPTSQDMLLLTELYAGAKGINSLIGLEYALNLTELLLYGNNITDIDPLNNLNQLTILQIDNNQLSDISALKGLTNLNELWLFANRLSDVIDLKGLTNLRKLSLGSNQISDIGPLEELTNLRKLTLNHNQIQDINALRGMTNLTELWLNHNQVSDITPLCDLMNLAKLWLHSNHINDINTLESLTSLTDLNLSGNQINDISALNGLTMLNRLDLSANQIMDISVLVYLTHLDALNLGDNQISNVYSLEGLTNLIDLNLSDNLVGDISALESLTDLRYLMLDRNLINEISPLRGLTGLLTLYMSYNQVQDSSDLRELVNLRTLDLSGNPVTDFSPITYLQELRQLYLEDNQITELTWIESEGLLDLTWLDLSNNQITDIGPLAGQASLYGLSLNNNLVSDITILSVLTNLEKLYLEDNQIKDISPLVGLTHLTELDLEHNPLNQTAYCEYIPQIEYNPGIILSVDPSPNDLDCNDIWDLQPFKLMATDGQAGDWFGTSVAINGNWAIVGAPYDNDNGKSSGSAYIFKRVGSAWLEHSKLLSPDGQAGDNFGISVSINDDWAIVGAWYNDEGGNNTGAAYVFKQVGEEWIQHTKLQASDRNADRWFGYSVSIDGDQAIVGQYKDDSNGTLSGSAYVFEFVGDTWLEQAKLLPSDGQPEEWFGMSVSLCGDWAVIGAPSPKAQNKTGSIYLFKQVGESWIEYTRLLASDGQAEDRFGYSVSITDGWIIAGASGDDDLGDSAGSVYLFKREGDTWIEHTKLLSSFGQTMDLFGSSVSVNGDWAIVGSPRYWNDPNNTGSAYLFKYEGDIWMESVRLFAPDDRLGVEFGLAVALESDKVIVASRRDKENGENAGAAYIFARLAQAGLSGY